MTSASRNDAVTAALKRRVQGYYPSETEAVSRIAGDVPLTFYYGIDPTGPSIHLGHTIQLFLLRKLQQFGHEIVLLIGDFTARIGDPTDKDAARTTLTADQVAEHMTAYVEQVQRILPQGSFRVEYNSRWLASMTMEEVIRLASRVTVQQLLTREMFQERIRAERPIYVHEFLYPLMQGYDSVALRTDGEVGGNDQTFNMLVGRELERELIGKDKLVLATRLLVDSSSGKKMSKSEGTLIALTDSPAEIRRKVLALEDDMTRSVFELCTDKPMEWIDEHAAAGEPRAFKEELARELASLYHGSEAVPAVSEAQVITQTGPLHQVLKESGLAASASEAKRLIEQGSVELNGVRAEDWRTDVKSGDRIRVGKGKFAVVH
jgi:tyrosyl-tRNA synthetase